jgi:hypothetical protein
MIGKKFTDLKNNRIVEVKDKFEDIIILDNNNKVKLNRLLDKDHFEEYIDPNSFFKNESLLNSFAQKIRQIPDNVIKNIRDEDRIVEQNTNKSKNKKVMNDFDQIIPAIDEPAILPADPELEKEELMRKYGITNNPILEAQRQLDKFKSILEETEEEIEEVIEDLEETTAVQTYNIKREEEIEDDFEEIENIRPSKKVEKQIKNVVEDPIITMFKNVKRNKDFSINIDFSDKIPRADFIEMMEDSYNTSIIEFLADEFMSKILEKPQFIREKIIDEIRRIVYGSKKLNETETKIESSVEPQKKPRGRKKIEKAND